ncbi:MAG: chorismate-binding protein, partial [Gammaproteobacteria bacterium]
MEKQQFAALAAQGYNRIPLSREVLADLDTPLSTYLKLADGPYSYLFESVQGGEKWGRYSIIGLPCKSFIEVKDHQVTIREGQSVVEQIETEDPLEWIKQYQAGFKSPELDNMPRFCGGLVGYFSYDTVRYIEPKLGACPNPEILDTPDILLMLSNEVVVFDNLRGKLLAVVYVDPADVNAYHQGQERLDQLVAQLDKPVRHAVSSNDVQHVEESDFVSGFTQQGFEDAVRRAKEYIVDGDVMQVVLSQRLSIPFAGRPLDLYRALRTLNPSPYMYYLNLDGFHIVGSSPEILVRAEEGEVTVRPIAGTRPRGKTEAEDLALEQDLLADPK